MDSPRNTSLLAYHWLVALVGISLLLLTTVLFPTNIQSAWIILFIAFFIGLQSFFPLEALGNDIYLINIIVLSTGLLYGLTITGWAALLGVFGGLALNQSLKRIHKIPTLINKEFWLKAAYTFSLSISPLVLARSLTQYRAGFFEMLAVKDQAGYSFLAPGVIFVLIYFGLFLIGYWFQRGAPLFQQRRDLLILVITGLLPLPLAILSIIAYPDLGHTTILVVGILATLFAVLVNQLSVPLRQLNRRAEELFTLNQISLALSSSLDLENLLDAIHRQVAQLLQVNNFYVALYDANLEQIWYPLAVKRGQRQHWPRRSLADRLTDRVIQTGKPILLPYHAHEQLARIGLPPSEDPPYAWIGVPLIASDHSIGCLALFSLSPEVGFTRSDLNLLNILSGQTSIAIEIALHNALLSSDVTIGRDRLSAVLNSVKEGVLLIEDDERITLANESMTRITGLPQSDFIGKRLSDLPTKILAYCGHSQLEAEDFVNKLILNFDQSSPITTYKIPNKVPTQVIERSITPLLSLPGMVAGWLILLRDVSEEYQMKETRDLISETLVHDLRSPMSAVLGALDVIEDTLSNNGPLEIIRASMIIARRSGQRVLGMVESMLDISRMQSGNIDLDLSTVNLKPLITHILSEFAPQASEYEITLINHIPEDLPAVRIDQNKIQRVINNLVDNALKFSPEKGKVVIGAEFSGDFVSVQVADTGPGIPKEYQEKIFERFGQVPGQSGRRRGSGLGLTYCRLAVEAHGGKIWYQSGDSGGSIFVFTLPLASSS